MKQPEHGIIYRFLIKGQEMQFKYIGKKGTRLVFEHNGYLTDMPPQRFDYLYNKCNLDGISEN